MNTTTDVIRLVTGKRGRVMHICCRETDGRTVFCQGYHDWCDGTGEWVQVGDESDDLVAVLPNAWWYCCPTEIEERYRPLFAALLSAALSGMSQPERDTYIGTLLFKSWERVVSGRTSLCT
jgi:hypothetical protein